jgi:hypothetical protein
MLAVFVANLFEDTVPVNELIPVEELEITPLAAKIVALIVPVIFIAPVTVKFPPTLNPPENILVPALLLFTVPVAVILVALIWLDIVRVPAIVALAATLIPPDTANAVEFVLVIVNLFGVVKISPVNAFSSAE